MPADEPTLHIGDVAERVSLSLRSVRYYEEQGLLEPEGRTAGGFRLYGETQIERLLLIKQMKPLGYALDEMRALLDARDVAADPDATPEARALARTALEGFATYTDERCAKLERAISAGAELARTLRDEASTPLR